MIISTVKMSSMPKLRELAEDPRVAAASTQDFRPVLAAPGMSPKPAFAGLFVTPALPAGVALPRTTTKGKSNFDTLRIVAQELLLPTVGKIWPSARPYVAGVQAIWATAEFWHAISDEEIDTTKRTIKGVRVAQKAVDALLAFQGAPPLATNTNVVAGYLLATADKLYVVRAPTPDEASRKQSRVPK